MYSPGRVTQDVKAISICLAKCIAGMRQSQTSTFGASRSWTSRSCIFHSSSRLVCSRTMNILHRPSRSIKRDAFRVLVEVSIREVASASTLEKLEKTQLSAARVTTGHRNSCPKDIVLYVADLQPLKLPIPQDTYLKNTLQSSSVMVTTTDPLVMCAIGTKVSSPLESKSA
ncbi:hypothetical protein TNCV_136901 [Trichonephila clavipes]|nr:hypothetical protein TNCV_136901 [Trichonephila clavipes]